MQTYEILDDDGNVINTIVADQSFVDAHFDGRYRVQESDGGAQFRPSMVITGIVADAEHSGATLVSSMAEVTCPVGTTLTVSAELRDPLGNVVPLSDSFRMPFRARDGREKVLLASMVDGLISITAPLRESGVWSASEATVNESLPPDFQMDFGGIEVFVVEA